MTKIDAFEWAAKLAETIAFLPDDAQIHNFELRLNTDTRPFSNVLQVHLSEPVDGMPAVNGKQYSGWIEKRYWIKPDVYVWWSEDIEDGKDC